MNTIHMVCQILSSSVDFVTIWASPFFHCFYFKPLFPPFSFDNLTIFRVFATILLVGFKRNLKNKTGFTFITKEFLFIMFWVSSVNVSFPFPQKRWLIITMRALLVFIYGMVKVYLLMDIFSNNFNCQYWYFVTKIVLTYCEKKLF